MNEIEHLNRESFGRALSETPGPLIVDFWAEWCGPCRVVAPMLGRLADEHPELRIAKLDVDQDPELASEYRVRGIPTLVRFDGGSETRRASGAIPYPELLRALGIPDRQPRPRSRLACALPQIPSRWRIPMKNGTSINPNRPCATSSKSWSGPSWNQGNAIRPRIWKLTTYNANP
jgi:thioredoxin 1